MQTNLIITTNWKELKTKIKEKYPKLTEIDLIHSTGKEDELVTRLALKLDVTEEEITDVIDDLQATLQNTERVATFGEKERGESHDAERRETKNRDAERNEKESQME